MLPVLGRSAVDVPGDLSVICTEDEPFWDFWSPPITVVDNRAEAMATRAADLLLAQLSGVVGGTGAPGEELIAPELVVRGSTARPAG